MGLLNPHNNGLHPTGGQRKAAQLSLGTRPIITGGWNAAALLCAQTPLGFLLHGVSCTDPIQKKKKEISVFISFTMSSKRET